MTGPAHPSACARAGRREQGVALITAVLVLVLVSLTAVASISNSEEELKAGGRSRSVLRSLYAAEAGVEFAEHRVLEPRDLSAFSINVNGLSVESRSRDDGTPQDIAEGGIGSPPPGYSINIGAGFVNEIFAIDVTAANATLPTTELEARVGVLAANSGAY